jgi:large subunit ribosomal protein L19
VNVEQKISDEIIGNKQFDFNVGDTVEVASKVVEGDKERVQVFRGMVIRMRGERSNRSFTVRKISEGVGVEKIFPLYAPSITRVKVVRPGKVRRAKLYYLRKRTGKKATAVKSKP